MQALTLTFAGVIADRQSFLDGARVYTLEAEQQPSAGWRLDLTFRWPVQSEAVDEGDLTITAPDGGEIFGTLSRGRASEVTDADGNVAAGQLDLAFDVTGGEGGYASVGGTARIQGTLAGEGGGTGGSFEGEGVMLTAELSLQGAPDLSRFTPEADIPTEAPRRNREPRGR